jgi:hypothetical protein
VLCFLDEKPVKEHTSPTQQFNSVDQSDDILWLAMKILENLRCWALVRARPKHLGFLLAAGSPAWWKHIPAIESISLVSRTLLDRYGHLGSTQSILEAIRGQWVRHELAATSPEIELLVGMGVPQMRAVIEFGQFDLFLKR